VRPSWRGIFPDRPDEPLWEPLSHFTAHDPVPQMVMLPEIPIPETIEMQVRCYEWVHIDTVRRLVYYRSLP
jgi:hypothetical protein